MGLSSLVVLALENPMLIAATVLAPLIALPTSAAPQATDPRPIPASLEAAMERALYRAEPTSSTRVELSNRAHRFRAGFESGRLELVGPGWDLTLELVQWGRPETLASAGPAPSRVDPDDGRRFEAQRTGLVEWYVNDARGLEQGFTIAERPAGPGPVWLVLDTGEAGVEVQPGGRGAHFQPEAGPSVAYSGLRAWDAEGLELDAQLFVEADRLVIGVDDTAARYPVIVDPWITVETGLVFQPRWPGYFQTLSEVDISGDFAVIGDGFWSTGPTHSVGAAWLFHRDGGGDWSEARRFGSTTTQHFGLDLDLEGELLAIGADDGVHLFERDHGGTDMWGEVTLLPGGNDVEIEGDRLAISNYSSVAIHERDFGGPGAWGVAATAGPTETFEVSLSGETLAVSHRDGWIEIYDRNSTTGAWDFVTTIDSDAVSCPASGCTFAECKFGQDLSLSGDTLLISNPDWSGGASCYQGRVFVHERDEGGADAWGRSAALVYAGPSTLNLLGYSVVLGGDYALAANSWNDAVLVFHRDSPGVGQWGEVQELANPGPWRGFGAAGSFGKSMALDGTSLAIASDNRLWSYTLDMAGAWVLDDELEPGERDPQDGFGRAVAISGETAVVGAWSDNILGFQSEGAVYVLERGIPSWHGDLGTAKSYSEWGMAGRIIPSDPAPTGSFGLSVDIEGDRIVVGAPREHHPMQPNGGAVYVFERDLGGAGNWGERAKLTASDPSSFAYFGEAVSLSGDTLLVGATQDANNGSAYLFERNLGGPDAWGQAAKLVGDAGSAHQFGASVSLHLDTAVVGSWNDGDGSAYVFERDLGGAGAWGQAVKLVPSVTSSGMRFGRAVSIYGDVIGVGAPLHDKNQFTPDSGRVFSFFRDLGGAGAWGEGAGMSTGEAGARFGESLAISGDVAFIGAPGADHPDQVDCGAAHRFDRALMVPNSWGLTSQHFPGDPAGDSDFGIAVDIDGMVMIAGGRDDQIEPTALGWTTGPNSARVFEGFQPSGVSYCTAGLSASGCQATLSALGTASATASSGFTVTASTVEGQKDGLYFFATNGRQANSWGNGTSFQCVVPPVTRAGLMPGSGSPGACDGSFAQDLNSLWCASCPGSAKNPGAGTLVGLQLWYRDPFNTSNQTTSLSDALEFPVGP